MCNTSTEKKQHSRTTRKESQYKEFTFFPRFTVRNFTLDDNLPKRERHFHGNKSEVGLGDFDGIPTEVFLTILANVDLWTITQFQRVNSLAWQVVNSMPEFNVIHKHAHTALRGILAVEAGHWITCKRFYATLCTSACQACGDFAPFVYILTCARVCFRCFTEKESYLPLHDVRAEEKFGLDHPILETIPQVRSLPGNYSWGEKACDTRLRFLDHDSALQAAMQKHGSISKMEECVLRAKDKKMQFSRIRQSTKSTDSSTSTQSIPVSHDLLDDRKCRNPWRFVAIVGLPFLDSVTKMVIRGNQCIACHNNFVSRNQNSFEKHWVRRFTVDTFDEHLKLWGPIINGIHRPDKGGLQ